MSTGQGGALDSPDALAPAKIGIDVTAAVTQGGGIGRFVRELVKAIITVDHHNSYRLFSAKVSGPPPVPAPLPTAANIQHRAALLNERWLYRLWHRLHVPVPVQWMSGPVDLFHSPDFVLPPVAGNIPTLLTVHDLSFIHYPETFPARLVSYLNRVVPRSIARATHVLADSRSTRDDLVELWHVPERKITVIYGGVNEAFVPVTDPSRLDSVQRRYGFGDAPYILSVGTLQPRKNYKLLIRAFGRIAATYPHNLVIAGGKGWLYEEMSSEVRERQLLDRVHFIGFVADEDLPALYSGSALFVFPSLYEGFGLPLLEAMACGVPVITSNASSLPEVTANSEGTETAILLSPHDEMQWAEAMAGLLEDAGRREGLIANGIRQAQRFTWRETAEQHLAVYQRLLYPAVDQAA